MDGDGDGCVRVQDPEKVTQQVVQMFDVDESDVLYVSAKTGVGMQSVLQAVVSGRTNLNICYDKQAVYQVACLVQGFYAHSVGMLHCTTEVPSQISIFHLLLC